MKERESLFDAIYSSQDKLPEDFTSRLDLEVVEIFKQGKETIFEDLKGDFPLIYDFIMNEMSEVVVVRHDGGSVPYFHWAMFNSKFNIFSAVSKTFRKTKLKRSEKSYFEALPNYLRVFYYLFDGFDFRNENRLSLHESGFLLGFSNWYNMEDIADYSAIGEDGYDEFINKFCSSDIRIILRQESGKVAFIDKSNILDGVWAGLWGELGKAEKVDDPIKFFNDCFFEAVNSFNS